jgi:amidase
MLGLLESRIDLPKHELVMLMSLVGQTEICQVVDPLKTARFVMPRWVLDRYAVKI